MLDREYPEDIDEEDDENLEEVDFDSDDEDQDEDQDSEDFADEDEEAEAEVEPKPKKKAAKVGAGLESEQITLENPKRPFNPDLPKNYYFDNDYVEKLLTEYVKGGCTDKKLRDEIMSNASELIRQIIRTHKLHTLTSGKEGTAFGDLYQLAWMQIESSLYKFDYRPGHTKVFNFWSQVAKTVMLAYIKKESRDKRNYGAYKEHLDGKHRPANFKMERFLDEAREICCHNEAHLKIIDALQDLLDTDNKPYDGLIDKLVKRSGMSRSKISTFLRTVRLRSFEFSDAPVNHQSFQPENKHRVINSNYETDDD